MADYVFTFGFDGSVFLQHFCFCGSKNAIKAAQHGKRKDHFTVFVPFVWTTKKIADAPDETGNLRMRFSRHGIQICRMWKLVSTVMTGRKCIRSNGK